MSGWGQSEPTYCCPRCQDGGMLHGLPCTADDWCGNCRRRGHRVNGDHVYSTPCPCRPTNRVWQDRLLEKQKLASGSKGQSHSAAA
jgi:hypothetical protein